MHSHLRARHMPVPVRIMRTRCLHIRCASDSMLGGHGGSLLVAMPLVSMSLAACTDNELCTCVLQEGADREQEAHHEIPRPADMRCNFASPPAPMHCEHAHIRRASNRAHVVSPRVCPYTCCETAACCIHKHVAYTHMLHTHTCCIHTHVHVACVSPRVCPCSPPPPTPGR